VHAGRRDGEDLCTHRFVLGSAHSRNPTRARARRGEASEEEEERARVLLLFSSSYKC
jgi:hypothetical protein